MKFCFKPPFRLSHARTPAGWEAATARVASRGCEIPPLRSTNVGAWKPRTALCVTQIRLRGTVLSTRVQAERQGPSMTTLWPDFRTCAKKFKYDPATPPALDRIRTSAKAGPMTTSDKATQNIKRRIEALLDSISRGQPSRSGPPEEGVRPLNPSPLFKPRRPMRHERLTRACPKRTRNRTSNRAA
jgi:hypothetical protein